MSHIRFLITARLARSIVLSIGFVSLASGFALGQQRAAPFDRAWDAIRREAEADRKEMAARFARLRALRAPVPAPAPVRVMVNQQAFPAPVPVRGGIALMEEIPLDPDADIDAPDQVVRVYAKQAFDFYAFGDIDGAERLRHYFDSLLQRKIQGAMSTRPLTESQIEKLRLAGKGDIKRRFDEIEAKRKEFAVARMDPAKGRDFVRELVQLRATQHSLFKDDSLFAKVLNRITESAEDARPAKPLPGSNLPLDKALKRANVIVTATDLRPLTQPGSSYPSTWSGDMTVTHSFKGAVARGALRLNAIPIAPFESLPTVRTDREFLLFIERTVSNGLKLHQVIKMLPATNDDVRFVEDALNR